MQIPIGGESSGRDDFRALVGDREGEAAVHAPPVQQDGAGPALPVIAALLGAGDPEAFAQGIEHRCAGVDRKPMLSPVHGSVISTSTVIAFRLLPGVLALARLPLQSVGGQAPQRLRISRRPAPAFGSPAKVD
jgi:hypothetical protein